jgi:hypothetical protein
MAGDTRGWDVASYAQNKPRSEDRRRRSNAKEGVERSEHDILRKCLGHDDLEKETTISNMAHIKNYKVGDPIRDYKGANVKEILLPTADDEADN